jgi:hypothetical protein
LHTAAVIPCGKTLVEKPVDNVEKLMFSTDIPAVSPQLPGSAFCMPGCISTGFPEGERSYVAAFGTSSFGKISAKKLVFYQNNPSGPPGFPETAKNLCEISTNLRASRFQRHLHTAFACIIPKELEILVGTILISGGHHAG